MHNHNEHGAKAGDTHPRGRARETPGCSSDADSTRGTATRRAVSARAGGGGGERAAAAPGGGDPRATLSAMGARSPRGYGRCGGTAQRAGDDPGEKVLANQRGQLHQTALWRWSGEPKGAVGRGEWRAWAAPPPGRATRLPLPGGCPLAAGATVALALGG